MVILSRTEKPCPTNYSIVTENLNFYILLSLSHRNLIKTPLVQSELAATNTESLQL